MSQFKIKDDMINPILVTGAHRTGTTWVGKMLAASRALTYISEPLNVHHRPGVMRARTPYWYTYICAENEGEYLNALKETLAFQYHIWEEIKSLKSVKDVLRMGRDSLSFISGRLLSKIPLIKDPFAVFSIPWFIERFQCRVLVVVRHPAAFVSSLVRLGWRFDFRDLLAQPLLMRDYLEPFREEMYSSLDSPNDTIAQASVLWRMIYFFVRIQRDRHPDLIVVRHEDLSNNPFEGFREIYRMLELPFNPRVEETIRKTSSEANPGEISKERVHSIRLDSRENLRNWKRRLNEDEIARIYQMTSAVASGYYQDQDWE